MFETVLILRHEGTGEQARAEGQAAMTLLRGAGFRVLRRSTLRSPRPRSAWEAVSGLRSRRLWSRRGSAGRDAENGAE